MRRLETQSFASGALIVFLHVILRSNLLLTETDKAHVWQLAFVEFLLFSLFSSVAIACDGLFMSKTADLLIVGSGLGVSLPMLDRLVRWINDLGFFSLVCKT